MPAPSAPPYQPPPYRGQAAAHISDLIQRRGDIEAQGLARPGGTVADLIGGVAQMTTGIMDRNAAAQTAHAKKMRVAQILGSGQPFDAAAIVNEFGIEGAKEIYAIYEVEEKRKQAQADRKAAEEERAKKASDEKNARGMRDMSMDAIDQGIDPLVVQRRHYGEMGTTLPLKDLIADPKEAKEAQARAAAVAALQTPGADPLAVNQNYWAASGVGAPSGVLPPKAETPKTSQKEFWLDGRSVMGDYIEGVDGKPGTYWFNGQNVTGKALGRPEKPAGSGGDKDKDKLSPDQLKALMDNIDQNPGLWADLTPTMRQELAIAGYSGQGKPLTQTAIAKISESKSAVASLRDLREVLQENEQYIGPLSALQSLNPYSDAVKAKSQIDLVRQRAGKALEGGVLREHDEKKYKEMLANIFNTPSTAIFKVDELMESVQRDIDIYIEEQKAAGRRVGTATEVPLHPDIGVVPPEVSDALKNQPVGVWELSDGSRWRVRADRSIARE